jgi:hypothetical protein
VRYQRADIRQRRPVRYSLTITLTPFRLQTKGRAKLVELVKKFAHEISLKLGSAAAGEEILRPAAAVRATAAGKPVRS